MKKLPLLIAAFVFATGALMAQQNEETEVKSVILSMFEAMKAGDSAKVRSFFVPGAVMQTIKSNGTAAPQIISDNAEGFIQSIGRQTAGVLDEKITFGSFYSDDQLATVVTPYRFFYNGTFSHCGINSIQLVKFPEGWKIQYIIDTRRKTGCF